MNNDDAHRLETLDVLKLFADDTRWSLLRALRFGDYQVGELVGMLKLPQNLASYHLNTLRQAGLVQTHRSEADARVMYYGLNLGRVEMAYHQIGFDLHLNTMQERKETPNQLIVFLCTGNSARSQMAEGWLRQLSQGHIAVRSAGTDPRPLHPMAVTAMAEAGIDIGYQQSKSIASLGDIHPHIVVTVCDRAREMYTACLDAPIQLHWSIADPVRVASMSDDVASFRQARDELQTRVVGLISALPELTAHAL